MARFDFLSITMGKVLSSLFSEKEKDLNIIIDFENAKPTEKVICKIWFLRNF